MAAHGKVDAFNESLKSGPSYMERLGLYFVANDVKEGEKKRVILLSSCGVSTYTIIRNLFAQDLPSMKSFKDIVTAAGKNFNLKPSSIVQCFRFNSRIWKEGESVAEFVSQLRHLSEHCEFSDTLDHMLCNRIVCGINDVRMQRRLLAEPGLTLAKTLELALALETADKDTLFLKGANRTSAQQVLTMPVQPAVHTMQAKGRGKHSGTAVICYVAMENTWQVYVTSKSYNVTYVARRVIFLKLVIVRNTDAVSCQQKKSQTLTMSVQTGNPESDTDDESYNLFTIGGQSVTPIEVNVTINQQPLTMKLDTGASYPLIGEHTYQSIWPEKNGLLLQESSVKLHAYTGV